MMDQEFLLTHRKLIWKVVNKTKLPPEMSRMDAFQVGFIGLMNAVRLYDFNKGSFYSYAKKKIKSEILEVIRGNKPISRHELKKIKIHIDDAVEEKIQAIKENDKRNRSIVFSDPAELVSMDFTDNNKIKK